jgi:steroid delta-isomerase-like uncharacterized protein
MTRVILGLALLALGIALAVVSGLADVIGLSGSEAAEEEFGWKQIVGVAAGAVAAVVGLVLAITGRRHQRSENAIAATAGVESVEGAPSKEGANMATGRPEAATESAAGTDNETAVRRLFEEAWNEGNLEIAEELLHPNVVVHDPALPEEIRGVDGFKELVSTYRWAFPDLRFTIEDLFSTDDKVAYRWQSEGTHQGELRGLAPTGNHGSVTGINIDRFVDGKFAESWVQWDNLGLMQQLGAAPAPGSRGEWAGVQVQRLSVRAREASRRLRERRERRRGGTAQ